MAACGSKCAKYTLFTFNLIFLMCALTVLGIGIWMLADKATLSRLTVPISDLNVDINRYSASDSVLQQAAYLFIASGIIGIIIAFVGCCGAIKEWRPVLITYAVLLLIILGLEIAAGIYAGVFRNTARDYVLTTMQTTLRREYTPSGLYSNGTHLFVQQSATLWTKTWDQMMIQLQCCGIYGGQDFLPPPNGQFLPLEKYSSLGPPIACCKVSEPFSLPVKLLDPACASASVMRGANNIHMGCFDQLMGWLNDNLQIMTGVGIGIGLVHIFGIVFSLCLCMAIQSEKS